MSQTTLDIKALFTSAKAGDLPVVESILAVNSFNVNQLYPDSANNAGGIGNNEDNPFSGLNILMVACKYGHTALAKSLVQGHRANVNAQSSKQTCENTALGIVAATGNNELVAFLQSKGANVNTKNANKDTPLHIACACGRGETAELLLKMGATFDAPNGAGETPLMLAAKSGLAQVVQTLIGRRANTKAVGRNGESVLHFAAQGGNPRVVQILIGHGADVTARCKAGKMPIEYCKTDNKACRDVFERELARLQEKADEYSKSLTEAPKKKLQQKKQQQKGSRLQPSQKRQQHQQQRKDATRNETTHPAEEKKKEEEHARKDIKDKLEEKQTEEKEEKEDSYAEDGWTVVKSRKKRTGKSETRKTQQLKPRPAAVTTKVEEEDDDDDDNTEDIAEEEEGEMENSETDGKRDYEGLTNKELQERVRKLEDEVKSFNSRHTKARKLKTKMGIWEKSLASSPQSEGLEITVSHVMESIFGSKNLSLLSPSQLCALEELHMNAIRNISQAKVIQAQKHQKAIIQEQHNK